MFWSKKSDPNTVCGAVIDVGSGSVGVAIVAIQKSDGSSKIIWSHREYSLLRTTSSLQESERAIKTSLINVFLELGNVGLRTLHSIDPNMRISRVQVSISAPWEYTTSKIVTLTDEKPFTVDEQLLNDLTKLSDEEVNKMASESDILSTYNLTLIDHSHIGISLNGYRMNDPFNKKTNDLSFVQLTTLAINTIVDAIKETSEKVLSNIEVSLNSFMTVYFNSIIKMYPHTQECCLINVTSEATEVGIVRDGALRHVHHIPVGTFSIARTIAEALNIPSEEAYTYLKANTEYGIGAFPEKKQEILKEIFTAYHEQLLKLFKNTGDLLSIPQAIFVHCEQNTEQFFIIALKKAAKETTNIEHTIHPVTSKLVSESHQGDTSILLGVRHFVDITLDTQ